MDRVKNAGKSISSKGIAKTGWHPSGDHAIHRDSWKSDLKGIATGKKEDGKARENALAHQSRPLGSLKDPDSFGPPPKHSGAIGSAPATPSSPARPQASGGWGSVAPAPRAQQQEERQAAEEETPPPPPVPYRTDTTGLTTNNLPKPPVRRGDAAAPPTPPRHSTPAGPAVPPRHQQPQPHQEAPAPILPPRMNDHPDEFTPPPPPSYSEATTHPTQRDPAALNASSVNRLGQAGVSVPGFGIGNQDTNANASAPNPPVATGHSGQLSELQQRFARMNAGSATQPSPPASPSSSTAAAAAHKKPPPPPPPKKPGLSSGSRPGTGDPANAPPPLPLSSKPRPE